MTATMPNITASSISMSSLTGSKIVKRPVTLAITRGYPGSGKTTVARAWCAEDPEHRAYLSRDDLRLTMWDRPWGLPEGAENAITEQLDAMVRILLAHGTSVIVDATHLRLRDARKWADLAAELDVEFEVLDVTTSPDECIARDAARGALGGRLVGHEVIRKKATQFAKPFVAVKPTAREDRKFLPYVANPDLPDGWVIDMDGTLAKKRMGEGERGWHDYHRVGEDLPNPAVVQMVEQLTFAGDDPGRGVPTVIILSGRQDYCMEATRTWLDEYLGEYNYDEVYMRATGDHRDDTIVKAELFDAHVRDRFNVVGVVDDRPRVCRMWRAMGLTTLQVGDPHKEF